MRESDLMLLGLIVLLVGGPFVIGLLCTALSQVHNKKIQKFREIVKTTSPRYHAISTINSSFGFRIIPSQSFYSHELTSKQQFDRFSLDEYFLLILSENLQTFLDLHHSATINERLYTDYVKQLQRIPPAASPILAKKHHVPYKQYLFYEEQLCSELFLHPVCKLNVVCHKYYCSPQGRNCYEEQHTYDIHDVNQGQIKLQARRQQQDAAQYQRSLMTPKLRYQILQRDNFRCVLCGRDQSSTPLEVDHIQPVSKGGKTEPHNLRTLCRDCNRGKSDAFVPNGNN